MQASPRRWTFAARRSSVKLHAGALAILVIVLTLAAIASSAWQNQRSHRQMREQMLAQAIQRNLQLADAMAGQIESVLARIDHVLLILRRDWDGDPARFDVRVRAELAEVPEESVAYLNVVDADGRVVFNSRDLGAKATFGDRASFIALRDAGDRLVIGQPVQSLLGNEWSILLMRPRLHEGRFVGAVTALVPVRYLSRRLTALNGPDRDIITLFDAGGRILARSIDPAQAMGRTARADAPFLQAGAAVAGSFQARSRVDGVERLNAWHRLPATGAVVLVGLDEAAILAPLDAAIGRDRTFGVALAALLAVFGTGIAMLLMRLAREQRAAAASRDLRYRLFESSHVAVAVVDGDLRFVDCNPAAAKLFGASGPEGVIGKRTSDFAPPVQPGGRLSTEGNYTLDAAAAGQTVFEWQHQRPNGEIWDGVVHMIRFESAGKPFFQCTMEDVTARRASDRMMRLLEFAIDKVGDELVTGDDSGRIIGVNKQLCVNLGMAADQIVGRHIWEIDPDFGPEDSAAQMAQLRRDQWTRFESRHRRRDGSVYPVEITTSLVQLDGKDYTVSYSRDISERKRHEQRLIETNEELEERVQQRTAELLAAKTEAERANLAKSDFLSRMSHELRTPLNAILGFGQLMELETDPAARSAGRVREILHAGRHLLELINEVLDLARVESGSLTVSPEPVALQPMLIECLSLLRPQAQAQGVVLPPGPPPEGAELLAQVDRTRLKQVLLNLLGNAIKFSPRGGGVAIECEVQAGAVPRWLRIGVRDEGPGLTSQQRERLFKPFERLDADERRIEGTGIGLALSKRLVELMGGEIGVDSTPGAGSTFWIRLRAAEPIAAAPPPSATAAAPARAAAASGAASDRHEVLCIEDNPANLMLLESVFAQRPEIRLTTADTPALGLERARAGRPALILLDINLPEIDGWAVMRCLRENDATRDIPVVAVTANATPADIERGKAAGFAAYVTKPLDVIKLLEVVDRLLARRSQSSS